MVNRYLILFLFLFTVAGCGRFDSQYTSVINSDEVSTVTVSCYNILGVPSICIVTEATTKTIRIEHVVNQIVERLVKKEVIIQVPIEKIVIRVEKQYIETDREVDIDKLVEFILDRIKEFVEPGDIIDIPIDDIIDETIDYITNPPPPNEDKDSTTMGDIRDDELVPIPPDDDKKDTTDPNTKNDGTNEGRDDVGNNPGSNTGKEPDGGSNNSEKEPDDGSNNGSTPGNNMGSEPDDTNNGGNNPGGNTGIDPDDGLNNGGNNPGGNTGTDPDDGLNNGGNNPGGNTGTDPDGGTNNGGNNGGSTPGNNIGNESNIGTNDLIGDGDTDNWTPPVGVATIRLRVSVGPKEMQYQPYLAQPGVSINISCNIDGTIVHPSFDGSGVFRGNKWNLWGVQVWCIVPADLDDSATTIHVDVSDFKRWCGLTSGDISVEKFTLGENGSSSSIGGMAALIDLSPNPVPLCNIAPTFTEGDSTTRSVAENLSSGVTVGAPVSATDQDDDTLEYSLSGTGADSFSIDSDSGQIKTSEILDHETEDSYSLLVSVTDNNGGTDQITVNISVTDVNDAPVFTENSPTSRAVAENLSSGSVVGTPVTATDQDDDTLEYSLSGTGADSFSIDSDSGQIKTSKKLNYEDQDTYSVIVTADDNSGGTTNITVNISVTDENDKPVFTEGFVIGRSVAENLAAGALIGDPVLATDEDGDTLEYSIANTNTDLFGVDSSSAQLSTKVSFNHEEQSSYSVTLAVTDNNGGRNGTFLTVTITDENDAPVFTEGETALRAIIESAASGSNVGHAVAATDEDEDTLTYSLSGTDASSFSLNTMTGRLSTNTTLDYDTDPEYTVTVSVTDNNGGSDQITVEIDVLEFYIEKQEFYEVYYAIKLDGNDLESQCYVIRGYGYDGTDPIYVDNYYKFEDGSSEQTWTGWSSLIDEPDISGHLESWKNDYSEEKGYTHGYQKATVHNSTAEAAAKTLYQAICNAASALGTWTGTTASTARGITYPDIDNNTSGDVLDNATILSYLGDDDCDPNN